MVGFLANRELLRMTISLYSFKRGASAGVTLLELLVVLMIIGIIVTAAVKTWDVTLERGRYETTLKELEQLAFAIAGNPELFSEGKRTDFGYVGDVGMVPLKLIDLVERPSEIDTGVWKGPYVKPTFQEVPLAFLTDAWGDTYIYDYNQVFIRSYGGGSVATPNTWMTRKIAQNRAVLENNTVSGTIVDAYGNPPGVNKNKIIVRLFYPYLGRFRVEAESVKADGYFKFQFVPIGNHKLQAVYYDSIPPDTIITDTVEKVISVYPRVGAEGLPLRFPAVKF